MRMAWLARALATVAALGALASCTLGRVAGDSGSCDRRKVPTDPKPFCQEIIDTVALSHFRDDCNDHLHGGYAEQPCTLVKAIGGCQFDDTFEDGSNVTDWYYSTAGDP